MFWNEKMETLKGKDLKELQLKRLKATIKQTQNVGFYKHICDEAVRIADGFSNTLLPSVTKLREYYYKITTKGYSTKVAYFAVSGATVDGVVPIVTLDEPIFS